MRPVDTLELVLALYDFDGLGVGSPGFRAGRQPGRARGGFPKPAACAGSHGAH
jgi:hypothetical protein